MVQLKNRSRPSSNFAEYSGLAESSDSGNVIVTLADIIRTQADIECLWQTGGIDISFSGFSKPVPKIANEGVIFSAREPFFRIEEDKKFGMAISRRTHVYIVIEAIAEEMKDVYKLRVEKDGPIVLVFPKREYAKRIEIFNAALLS